MKTSLSTSSRSEQHKPISPRGKPESEYVTMPKKTAKHAYEPSGPEQPPSTQRVETDRDLDRAADPRQRQKSSPTPLKDRQKQQYPFKVSKRKLPDDMDDTFAGLALGTLKTKALTGRFVKDAQKLNMVYRHLCLLCYRAKVEYSTTPHLLRSELRFTTQRFSVLARIGGERNSLETEVKEDPEALVGHRAPRGRERVRVETAFDDDAPFEEFSHKMMSIINRSAW